MNIFILSLDPREAGYMLHDIHMGRTKPNSKPGTPKMVIEGLQALATAYSPNHFNFGPIPKINGEPYGIRAHVYHRCSRWARENVIHMNWILLHIESMCEEYRRRWGKTASVEMSVKAAKDLFMKRVGVVSKQPSHFAVADGGFPEFDSPTAAVRRYNIYYNNKISEYW